MVKELTDYHWCVKETLNAYILQEIFIYFPSSTMRPLCVLLAVSSARSCISRENPALELMDDIALFHQTFRERPYPKATRNLKPGPPSFSSSRIWKNLSSSRWNFIRITRKKCKEFGTNRDDYCAIIAVCPTFFFYDFSTLSIHQSINSSKRSVCSVMWR